MDKIRGFWRRYGWRKKIAISLKKSVPSLVLVVLFLTGPVYTRQYAIDEIPQNELKIRAYEGISG